MTDLVTLEQVKGALNITKTDRDVYLQGLIDSLGVQVGRNYGLSFDPAPPLDEGGGDTGDPVDVVVPIIYTAGSLMPPGMRSPAAWGAPGSSPPFPLSLTGPVSVKIPLARQIDAVSWDETALTTDQYVLGVDPRLLDTYYRIVTMIDGTLGVAQAITVTGRFGITPTPADIVDAITEAVAYRYEKSKARFGDAVQMNNGSVVSYFGALPQSVRQVFDSYIELGA